MTKKRPSLSSLKRRQQKIEQEGYLLDCWIGKYQPAGTAKGENTYFHLRSRKPLPHGKKSQHLKADEVPSYQHLIANGRALKKLEKQIQQLTHKRTAVQALTSSETDEWSTPPHYIQLAKKVMGAIDLDPASNHLAQQWIQADTYYTIKDNGLMQPWFGRLWLNPPYGNQVTLWTEKAVNCYETGAIREGILLVKPAVGSKWYQRLSKQLLRCEPDERIKFINAQGQTQSSPVHGNALFYLGTNRERFQAVFSAVGTISVPC